MPTRITVVLDQPEYAGLVRIADAELRDPRDQLRILLRRELARCGYMPGGTAPLDRPAPRPAEPACPAPGAPHGR